ncbi:cyclase family protein [Mariniflexile sp. AS56]|uniref:cyclase family protein n=1 Tax=Mariniflexile sp. AS56 TaxID=3063957 RepID=UPI0026ECC5D0|nr:cyclase family protein [Mariniflexile sp. AS56]MDO7170883.1 cyclase family protein [Mariniflexile sp. AS56]
MIATIQYNSKKHQIDLSKPLDISIPLKASKSNVNAWYLDAPKIDPVIDGDWVGSVQEGASVNFNTINFNPHAHGTHTECVGHITKECHSVNKNLKQFFFLAEVITVAPEVMDGDFVISKKQLQTALGNKKRDAVVIRTLPNTKDKKSRQYSNTNPTYLQEVAAIYLKEKGVKHVLIDLPSVDKEKDEGKLLAHNAFWNTQGELRLDATITELIYVPNKVKDGVYFLNLQIAPFENDATPSKPILYKVM